MGSAYSCLSPAYCGYCSCYYGFRIIGLSFMTIRLRVDWRRGIPLGRSTCGLSYAFKDGEVR